MPQRSIQWVSVFSTLILVACTGGGPSIDLPVEQDQPITSSGQSIINDEQTTSAALNVDDQNNSGQPNNGLPQTDANIVLPNINALVSIPRIVDGRPPAIDGQTVDIDLQTNRLIGEWESAVQTDRSDQLLTINSLMESNGVNTTAGTGHRWAALHDGTYLYLLVISDDNGEYRFDTQEIRKPWKDDDLEIYFDGNNSLLSSYDGVDDFHMHINLIDPVTSQGNNSFGESKKLYQAVNSATLPADLSFSVGLQRGPLFDDRVFRSDIYEIRIKLSELNIIVGQPFGFELQLNDDDDGETRDTKWGWHHPAGSDQAWENPSLLATVILQ